jgi:hypothetical protein
LGVDYVIDSQDAPMDCHGMFLLFFVVIRCRKIGRVSHGLQDEDDMPEVIEVSKDIGMWA